nr:retrovirus-related Pol polyprotein from transposon TNT 1-94 [Tanacetum cinerariifolium]
RHIKEPIWYLDSGCSRSMTGVKSYLYKYVEQPGPKLVFGDNSSCITEGCGSINCGDINSLAMEQYLALSRENQASSAVKPEIKGNVNFVIKSQFMRELREDTFSRNKNEDAHDHVDRVLNILSLFNILEVSQDVVLLRVFPFSLTRAAKRWVDRLTLGAVNTWDLFKKAFI